MDTRALRTTVLAATLAFAGAGCQPASPVDTWQEATARVVAEADPFVIDTAAQPERWLAALRAARPDSGLRAPSPPCGGLLARDTTERLLASVRELEQLRPAFLKQVADVAAWRARVRAWRDAVATSAEHGEWLERLNAHLELVDAHLAAVLGVHFEDGVEHADRASRSMQIASVVAAGLRDGASEPPIAALPEGAARTTLLPVLDALASSSGDWKAVLAGFEAAWGYGDDWLSLREHHDALLRSCYPPR